MDILEYRHKHALCEYFKIFPKEQLDNVKEDSFEKLFRKLNIDEEEMQRKVISMHQFYSTEEEKE